MVRAARLILTAAAFAGLVPAAAEEATEVPVSFQERIGRWVIVGDPAISACLAWRTTEDGATRLTIASRAAESTMRFSLANPAWKSLTTGGMKVDATFLDSRSRITNMWTLSSAATSEADGGPRVYFDIARARNDNASFLDQFKRGSSIWFWRDEVPIAKFTLEQSAGMMDALVRCRAIMRLDNSFDPFAGD